MLNLWTCSLIFEKLLAFFSQVVSYCWLNCDQALIQNPANGESVKKQAYPVSHISCLLHGIFSFRKFFTSIVFPQRLTVGLWQYSAQSKDCNMEYLKLIRHVCFTLFVFLHMEYFYLHFVIRNLFTFVFFQSCFHEIPVPLQSSSAHSKARIVEVLKRRRHDPFYTFFFTRFLRFELCFLAPNSQNNPNCA